MNATHTNGTGRKIAKRERRISEDDARRRLDSVPARLPGPGMTENVVSGSMDGVYVENRGGAFFEVHWNVTK